jgi:putative aminopeptidase FrvX
MTPESLKFLKSLLDTPGPSSFEASPARLWRAEAQKLADSVDADVSGNSLAALTRMPRRASCWPATSMKSGSW